MKLSDIGYLLYLVAIAFFPVWLVFRKRGLQSRHWFFRFIHSERLGFRISLLVGAGGVLILASRIAEVFGKK